MTGIEMKKVKITVLRKTFNEDMAKEYAMPGLKPCQALEEGQVFYAGLGVQFTPMCLPLPMALKISISMTG